MTRWGLGLHQLRKITSTGNPVVEDYRVIFDNCRAELSIKQRPELIDSADCPTPFVSGIVHPVVIVPPDYRDWNVETARTVFLHELAHLKGRDPVFLALGNLARILHWPNPLSWISAHARKEAAELAADEAVVQSGIRPTDYATSLCRFAAQTAPRKSSLGLTMADTSTGMEQRIGRLLLLDKNKQHKTMITKLAITTVAAGTLAVGGLAFYEEKLGADSTSELIKGPVSKSLADQIKIPVVDFEGNSLADIVDYLRVRSAELDPRDLSPQKKGLNFVFEQSPDSGDVGSRKVDRLQLKNVPLSKVLALVAKQTKTKVTYDMPNLVIIADMDVEPLSPETAEKDSDHWNLLTKTIVPVFDVENVRLDEVADFLRARGSQLAGEPVNILIEDEELKARKVSSLILKDIPMTVILAYVADKTNTKFVTSDDSVTFVKAE